MFDIEALFEAHSADEAIALLVLHPEARIIAGGSDILIKIREGSLAGCTLVSIQTIDSLRGVSMDADGALRIGALTSFSRVARDPLVLTHIPVLAEAALTVGGPQLRNTATIGGNICNGASSADSASTLVAYEALLEYRGSGGTRIVPISAHYVGAGKTALAHDEILQSIIIPQASYERCFGCYIKYAMREALDIATLGCSANVRLSADGRTIERARFGYGVAGPVPMRAFSAEAAATGRTIGMEAVEAAAKAALSDVQPRTSWRAAKEFRIHLAEELAKRTLAEALRRAGADV
jgi:xanthine dehydrogenase FAD-binding subunit